MVVQFVDEENMSELQSLKDKCSNLIKIFVFKADFIFSILNHLFIKADLDSLLPRHFCFKKS